MAFRFLILTLSISMTLLLFSHASGQITTSCTSPLIDTFSPCMNYVTNSSFNGTSPTTDCCNSLKSLVSNSSDCLCLIVTGRVPSQVPIIRNLAISLPGACNMPGVSLQCEASGAPVPAPSPTALAPSPIADEVPQSPRMAPEATPMVTTSDGAPTSNMGPSSAGLTASAAQPSCSVSSVFLLAVSGAVALKYY